jgi:Raf kinase inhibitor-like YbhB/YbcL family protein
MNFDPYESLPKVATFTVTSADMRDGESLAAPQLSGIFGVPGGQDRSPQLSWSGFPEASRSFAVTLYDPDAPTASGFWHWAVVDIPVSVTSLRSGAGDPSASGLPTGAFQLQNDARLAQYLGAAPPSGHGRHRYMFVVHAVDVASLGIDKTATPAFLGFNLLGHTIARARLTPWYERD